MKVSAFAQVGYRTFPEDFEQHHDSSVDTPWRLADPREVRAAFRDYLDGLMLAARSGFDGVVFTEHAQASYDMSANPSLTASALAYATESEGLDVAIFPAGRSLGKSREPVRVAEEYAAIDTVSGGRLVAGFPVGLPYDVCLNNGIPPIELRPRFDEVPRYSIYAPEVPGTSAGDPHAIHEVDGLPDLVLIYEEAIRQLELPEPPVVIGQSFGGMLAAELASYFPQLFKKVVLCDPIGLWQPDLPIANWITTPASQLPALLFKNPDCPAAKAMSTPPPDPALAATILSNLVWALGCTGKFVWPIPEKGLHKRLHRVTAPTMIVWGEDDVLVPAAYAKAFGAAIAGSRVEIVRDAGHIPQAEQMETTLVLVREFLAV